MLTEKQIKAMKPAEKEFTVSDGRTARGEGVLFLRVRPNGTKEFYFQRYSNGKEAQEQTRYMANTGPRRCQGSVPRRKGSGDRDRHVSECDGRLHRQTRGGVCSLGRGREVVLQTLRVRTIPESGKASGGPDWSW